MERLVPSTGSDHPQSIDEALADSVAPGTRRMYESVVSYVTARNPSWSWTQRAVETLAFTLFKEHRKTLLTSLYAGLAYWASLDTVSSQLWQQLDHDRLRRLRTSLLSRLARRLPRKSVLARVRARRVAVPPQQSVALIDFWRSQPNYERTPDLIERVAVFMAMSFLPCRASDFGLAKRGDFEIDDVARQVRWRVLGTKGRRADVSYDKVFHFVPNSRFCPASALAHWLDVHDVGPDEPAFPSFAQVPGGHYAFRLINNVINAHRGIVPDRRVTSHSWRHTTTILLRRAHVPDDIIQHAGNWRSLDMVNTYSRDASSLPVDYDWSRIPPFSGNMAVGLATYYTSLSRAHS